jgi:diguanylate cyclase (GGDEF)-like protein
MFDSLQELPRAAWWSIVRWTIAVGITSVGASVAASAAIMSTMSHGLSGPGLMAAIVLPLALGGPMTFWHLVRLQQLRLANQKLHVLASTDWLTDCLNRRAFTHLVSDLLSPALEGNQTSQNALLVIDADHFKTINDHYGHDRGDEALLLMAKTIKSMVREGDLVARIGGEEFGVFLRGADRETTMLVAERLRKGINATVFAPEGTAHALSASIGGAVVFGATSFTELFRMADQNLYRAKQSGRNRVEIGHAGHPGSRPLAPAPALKLAEAG